MTADAFAERSGPLETVFRTEGLPAADRFDRWYHLIQNSVIPAIVRPEHPHDFGAAVRVLDLTTMQVVTTSQANLAVSRPRKLVRQSDPEQCYLLLLIRGRLGHAAAGRCATVRAGELMFADSSCPFDGWVAHDENRAAGTAVHVQFPRAMLPRPALVDELAGRPLSGGGGLRTLISGYLRELVRPAAGYRPADAAGLAITTMDLVTALVASESHTEDPRPPELRDRALLNRILEFMRQRLGDPGLCPDMIAAANHISTRYLHKLFQSQDLTVAAWIRRHRLDACHRDLADPAQHHRPIHAVATRWGFTDNAHFSRLFRSAYGISPSDYRHLAATGRSARNVNGSTPGVNDFPAVL